MLGRFSERSCPCALPLPEARGDCLVALLWEGDGAPRVSLPVRRPCDRVPLERPTPHVTALSLLQCVCPVQVFLTASARELLLPEASCARPSAFTSGPAVRPVRESGRVAEFHSVQLPACWDRVVTSKSFDPDQSSEVPSFGSLSHVFLCWVY